MGKGTLKMEPGRIFKWLTRAVTLATLLVLCTELPATETKIMRLAAIQPADHDLTKACYHLAKLVEERSAGKIKIEVYPAGQLFSDKDLTKALPSGSADLAQVTTGIWVGMVPALGIIELPFFYQDMDHVARAFSDPKFRKILDTEMAQKGVKLLFPQTWGYSFGFASKKQLHTLEDFRGRRIRAHGEMPAEVIRSLGAAPVFMGTGDVYLGLQRGTIDGVMTAPCLAWDKKYYECVRHYVHLKSSDLMSPPLTLMNLKTYADLTPEFQKLIDTAARETEAFSLKLSTDRSQECAKSLQGQKVEVYPLPDTERQRWAKACGPILQNYLKRNGEVGQRLVQEVENLKK